jgi:Mrp family chromosome partitioning ATPase
MRNDMKHIPQSLLERAAELYDFGAALRAPAPAAVAEPEPVPVPVPTPVAVRAPVPEPIPEPVFEQVFAPSAEPAAEAPPVLRVVRAAQAPAPRPRPSGDVAEVDRAALVAAGFIVADGPVTGLAEEFRLIKHQLLADMERSQDRSVLICSAQPKAGKTFCAINLALSLAGEKGVEVLLVDGDFLKPDALSLLGIDSGGPGFVDALADPAVDPESLIIRTDVPGLCVLPAGRKTNNVPELLASDRTREVLAKLVAGDGRRIVLFDSPPALMASPATMLAGLVGQTLVVVRADQTTEADLRETIGLLSACDHVGLLLNGAGVAVSTRKFGAYDGYGHDQD